MPKESCWWTYSPEVRQSMQLLAATHWTERRCLKKDAWMAQPECHHPSWQRNNPHSPDDQIVVQPLQMASAAASTIVQTCNFGLHLLQPLKRSLTRKQFQTANYGATVINWLHILDTAFLAKGFDAQLSTTDNASTKVAITLKISVHVCVCVWVLIKSVPSITCMLLGDKRGGRMVMLQHVKKVCTVQWWVK